MKKTVYTKAGQVGLVEVERPQIEAPDDAILRIVRTCVWSNREILSSHLSPMAVGSVMPVVQAMMGRVTVISAPTGLMECKRSTSVSTLLIGPLSRFQGNLLIIQKLCLNPS